MTAMRERRRSPRVTLQGAGEILASVRQPVKLLDISLSGALISSDVPLPVGARGRLVAAAPGGPLATFFFVSRRRVDATSTACTLGVSFVDIDERSRQTLEHFLKRASE